MYIPLTILFIPMLRRGINYVLFFSAGVLFVFPLFNNFRYLKEGVFKFNYELFNSGHFDAFQNLAWLLNTKIITNGRQFLGSLFFFIQENQWSNRPVGTGNLVASKIGYTYTNVAMPYFGEGYANWGYVGVFLFLVIILFTNTYLDGIRNNIKTKTPVRIVYLFLVGYEFYLMRGDLMSSLKMATGFGLALLLVLSTIYIFNINTFFVKNKKSLLKK